MFDVDKVNIYFPNTKEKYNISDKILNSYKMYQEAAGEEALSIEDWAEGKGIKLKHEQTFEVDQQGLYTKLLELEKQILLHPRNAHHLFMPVVDDIFSKNAYKSIYEDLLGSPMEEEKSIFSSLTPQTNVNKSMIFVKGKLGVGIVARFITSQSTGQADQVKLSKVYYTLDNGELIARDNTLYFEGQDENFNLDNYTDADLNIISEALSQLLTTQVDNVKDPKAVKLGINMQTLGVLGYLMQRGVSTNSIIKFLNQPLIKLYLKEQKINESLINKNNGDELMKDKLIRKVLDKAGFKGRTLYTANDFGNWRVREEDLDNSLKNKSFDENQLLYLSYFLEIIDQTRALSKWSNDQTADTTPLKDRSAVDGMIQNQQESMINQMVPVDIQNKVRTNGVIAPFTQARDFYDKMYKDFYFTVNSLYKENLLNFKNQLSKLQKTQSKKDKVFSTVDNDFVLYFVQNYALKDTQFKSFDELMGKTNKPSLAQRIKEAKKDNPTNLVLNAFFPILSSVIDEVDNKYVDSLRLFERQLTTLDINDYIDAMRDIADSDLELYTDLVTFIFYQSGLNNSPFNYSNIIPQAKNSNENAPEYEKLFSTILSQAIRSAKQLASNQESTDQIFNDFQNKFLQNKKQFLRSRSFKSYPYDLLNKYDKQSKKTKLWSISRNEYLPALGSTFFVRYNTDSIRLLDEQSMVKEAFLNDNDSKLNLSGEEQLDLIGKLILIAQSSSNDSVVLKKLNNIVKSNNATKQEFNELLDFLYKSKVNFDAHGIIEYLKDLYNSQFLSESEFTPENIQSLKPNEVFVFGSNNEGRHGKGAALVAKQKFGAKYGQASGLQGQSYAIVTKDLSKGERSIPLNEIGKQLQDLMLYAKDNPNLKFYVTKLGSSLAGYSIDEIKEIFNKLKKIIPSNVVLPIEYEVRQQQSLFDYSNEQSNNTPMDITLNELYVNSIDFNKTYTGSEVNEFVGKEEYYKELVSKMLEFNKEFNFKFFENQKGFKLEMFNDYVNATNEFNPKKANEILNSKSQAAYSRYYNKIYLSSVANQRQLIHELVHATVQTEYNKNPEFKANINMLYEYADKYFLDHKSKDEKYPYGFTNPTEFLAEALSNPEFMKTLNNIPFDSGNSIFGKLLNLISDFLNNLLGIKVNPNSVLSATVDQVQQIINLKEINKNKQTTSVSQEVLNNFSDYFPQYDYLNEEQKKILAESLSNGETTIQCQFNLKTKFGR